MTLENHAKLILEEYPIYKKLPSSISNKYHIGETQMEHLQTVVNIMSYLCEEFKIKNDDRDMLFAASWLHDLGLYIITRKGIVDLPGWKYYEQTGYSRLESAMKSHGTIGAELLNYYDIKRKKEIQRLISVHMSHWYPLQPQPETTYEKLICIADYLASKGNKIFKERVK